MGKKYTDIADMVAEKLLSNGFIVHRYDAYTSNSIYLKLDYGVCYSIRISDHRGKKHLLYRYNVIIGGDVHEDMANKRWYYNEDTINDLIQRILSDRDRKKELYGEHGYKYFIEQNKQKAENAPAGFWSGCRQLRKGQSI